MPLPTFSRILSSRSPSKNPQLSSDTTEPSLSKSVFQYPKVFNRSSYQDHYPRRHLESPLSAKSNKPQEARAFSFSIDPFNRFFGSIRKRRQAEGTGSRSASKDISYCSYSTYSGYVDDEYGESDAEAEEIRRPSGLGPRAGMAEGVLNRSDFPDERYGRWDNESPTYSGGKQEDVLMSRDIEISRISYESVNAELVEIRYPSGLGEIRRRTHTRNVDRPRSTYPFFEGQKTINAANTMSVSEPPVVQRSMLPPGLSGLSRVIPLLAPYLSRKTLLALNLVDRAVAELSRRILWTDVTLHVTVSPSRCGGMKLKSRADEELINILSTRRELARLVRSLELHCNFVIPTRPRPPPLSFPSESRCTISLGNTPSTPSRSTRPHTSLGSLEAAFAEYDAQYIRKVSQKPINKDESVSNYGQNKSLSPPLSFKLSVSKPGEGWQAPIKKLRPTSVQLFRGLSTIKRRSIAAIGPITTQTSLPIWSPIIKDNNAGFLASSSRGCTPGESTWTPPPDWERTTVTAPSQFPVVPASPHSGTTGWDATPNNSSMKRRSRPRISISSSSTKIATPNYPGPVLKNSPSLPCLYARRSPSTPGLAILTTTLPTSLPRTTVPSPATPYSNISLSAFPLPPQTLDSAPSPPPHVKEVEVNCFPSSPSTPTSRHMDHDFVQTLEFTGMKLVNLTHISLLFASPSTSASTFPRSLQRDPGHCEHDVDNFDIDVIERLRSFLLRLDSLHSMKVECAAADRQDAIKAKLSVLKDTLQDLKVDVVYAS